jgi:tRNA-specific 2-thiouridylase
MEVSAKVRYFSPVCEATIEPAGEDQVKVVFKKPQWAITPGQSVVFYKEDLVVGGGVIERVMD